METKEKSYAVKIQKEKAEETRRKLIEEDNLRTDLKIDKNNFYVFLPVKNKELIKGDFEIIKKGFEKNPEKIKSYQEKIKIPEELKKFLPTSYDVIGNIILIKIPEELKDYRKEIGSALLNSHINIKTIFDSKPVSGELRTRRVELIAGEKNTTTVHKENDVSIMLDVEKTYFSPRLANERRRIASKIKNDEIVVDMFTGVAPFPCVIAKHAKPNLVYGIDKNKIAVEFAKKNIMKNKLFNKIKVFHDDARNVSKILKKEQIKADRVIMNLPFSSIKFFSHALSITKKDFVIHYYEILSEEDIKNRIKDLKRICSEENISILSLEYITIKSYSPTEFYIGFDITAKKNIV